MKRHPVVEEDLAQICAAAEVPWAELAGTTVLVTGAGGLVASYVVESLLRWNELNPIALIRVLALVRDEAKARRRFAAYEGRGDLVFLVQDVCLPLPAELRADFIVHAASPASPKYFGVDPVGTLGPNVLGTHHLLELARRSAARGFVFLSSGEVYGRVPSGLGRPLTEDDYGPLDPLEVRACYGESKRAGEMMCKAWQSQFGVPARIARLGHTYGPGMDLADGRVFADFVGRMVRGENIVLLSDGLASRPFCYLSDAVRGLLVVLLLGQPGSVYNLVNDEGLIRIRDLAECLVSLVPEKRLRVVASADAPDSSVPVSPSPGNAVDTGRLRQLGWRPRVSVLDGFRRTIRFYS